jgi:putative transcriptional regulator
MMRVRLKADGRLVEVTSEGHERVLPPPMPEQPAAAPTGASAPDAANARRIRSQTRLTQAEFAARIDVPIETVRNWEQGKRSPRGPARALLKLLDHAPDVAFSVLGAQKPQG